MAEDKFPLQRWPGVLQPDVRQVLPLPVPPHPTSAAGELRARLAEEDPQAHPSKQLLQDVLSLLGPVQVKKMHLLRPAPAELPEVSPLQSQLTALQTGIFSTASRGAMSPPPAPPSSEPQQTALRSPGLNGLAELLSSPRAPAPAAAAAAKAPKLRHGGTALAAGQPASEKEVAEAFTAHVAQLLGKHAAMLQAGKDDEEEEGEAAAMESEGEDEEDDDELPGPSSLAAARKQRALLEDVRRLAEETMRVCQTGGAVKRVPTDTLLQLLRLLTALIEPGSTKYIGEDEKGSGAKMQGIHVAMEAATAALRILCTPDLPQQVYNEDLLEAAITLTKFQLANNVYAFHDARFRGPNRPRLGGDDEDGQESPTAAKKKSAKKGKKGGGIRIPVAVRALQDRCQAVLGSLAELLGVVSLNTGTLVPLVRVAMQALTVEGIPLLQGRAIDLLAAAFQHYPAARQSYLADFFAHVVAYFVAGKRAPRDFVPSEDSAAEIQMLTAAVLQMVQASVALPAMDSDPKQMPKCYAPAVHWSDYFWSLCFDRLPAARAAKSETEQDFKLLLEQLLADLLEVACLPEWPAASVLLLRFMTTLNGPRGLQHSDGYVRQTCVDLLGQVAARLHQFHAATEGDADWLQQLAEAKGVADATEAANSLLLEFLAERARGASATSARRFLLCRSFAEEATVLQRTVAGEEELQALLAQYRRRQDEGAAGEAAVAPADARRLAQALVQKMLGNARQSTILWLLEALDPRQAPTTRAKAVKALGVVVEADPAVLDLADVQKAVDRALQDDSTSVREAALDLLGRHISGNQRLATRLFGTLAKASQDSGVSVRKRAIKILWESCIRVPDFPLSTEACKHVLMRASDNEESIQDMVSRVFHSLWFTSRLDTGGAGGGAVVVRSAAQRAQQLADVAQAVYEAGGPGIHLPLDLGHPLVVVLRSALGFDAKGDLEKEWAAGREISQALLAAYLQAEEVALADANGAAAEEGNGANPGAAAHPGFAHLLSLHALVVTDVELCMPAKDPAKFVRVLSPYLKPPAGSARQSEEEQRRGAEELLCVLSVLDGILSQLPSLEAGVDVAGIVNDLQLLINKTSFPVVLGSACKCLCTAAAKSPAAAPRLAETALAYYNWLCKLAEGQQGGVAMLTRVLFTLSQLCRYGAAVIERAQQQEQQEGKEQLSMQDCLALFCSLCKSSDLRVQQRALEALGNLTIARPAIMMQSKQAAAILESALRPSAPAALKVRALSNLNEMLRSDEQQLLARQQDVEAAEGLNKGKKGKKGKGGGVVQAQNGEGDSLSLSSGILQRHWDSVLRLATDATPTAGNPSTSAPAASADVRRAALVLIETVLRGGLVAPWTAVAPLVALTTDPHEDLRSKAMRLLKQEAEKRGDFLENKLPAGVVEVFEFHARLRQAGTMPRPRGVLPREVAAGLKQLYRELVQPNKTLRSRFLQNLLKGFESGIDAGGAGGGGAHDLELLRFCAAVAAELPYKKGDEPCSVVQQVNTMVARRGAGVLEDFKAALTSEEEAGRAEAAAAQCSASLVLSLLLLLKDFLKKAYSINAERIAAFGPSGERRKNEERINVSALEGVPCHLDKLELGVAGGSGEDMVKQYKIFKRLMSDDAADYDHVNHPAAGNRRGAAAAAAAGAGAAEGGGGEAGGEGPADDGGGTPGWIAQTGPGAKVTRGRKRGGGATVTRGRGGTGGRGRTVGRAGSRKKRKGSDSDDSEADEDYTPTAATTKKKLKL